MASSGKLKYDYEKWIRKDTERVYLEELRKTHEWIITIAEFPSDFQRENLVNKDQK